MPSLTAFPSISIWAKTNKGMINNNSVNHAFLTNLPGLHVSVPNGKTDTYPWLLGSANFISLRFNVLNDIFLCHKWKGLYLITPHWRNKKFTTFSQKSFLVKPSLKYLVFG
jgi:hypothetical protein